MMGITTTQSHLGNVVDGGYVTPDPSVYNAVADEREHEMPRNDDPMVVPRHDQYAAENGGGMAERVEPYTATGANPSYPEDRPSGIVEPDPDVEREMNEPVDPVPDQEVPDGDAEDDAQPEAEGETQAPAETTAETGPPGAVRPPNGNGSGEEWRAYAISTGMSPEEADSKSRDELRDQYAG